MNTPSHGLKLGGGGGGRNPVTRALAAAPKTLSALTLLAAIAALILYVYSAAMPAAAQSTTDYDTDGDNLIEISDLAQLSAVRYDLNGDGVPSNTTTYAAAFPGGNIADTSTPYMGCEAACEGYELTQSLTFPTSTSSPHNPWLPIGYTPAAPTSSSPFITTFDGNGHTLTGLNVANGHTYTGLFGQLDTGAVIRDLGLINGSVRSGIAVSGVGMLTGENFGGTITAVYVDGGSVYFGPTGLNIGGLAGGNQGTITASYSTAAIHRESSRVVIVGGLVGLVSQNSGKNGTIINSYAAAPWTGTGSPGNAGLVGNANGGNVRITGSYCDSTVAAWGGCVSTSVNNTPDAQSKTTAELQAPTGYTGIYANWNIDLDGDTFPDNPWNFGTTTTLPVLNKPDQRTVDHDPDDDNLINVDTLQKLNAIRHDLNGDGLPAATTTYAAYAAAFPGGHIADTSTPYMGCESTCIGYELTEDLDFAADGVAVTSTDAYPNWAPIGPSPGYSAEFNGNGHTISRLTITGTVATVRAGLFDTLASGGVIRDVGMIAPSVSAGPTGAQAVFVGVLTASNGGTITASYVQGGSVTVTAANKNGGGLSGGNTGTIQASYSTASVDGGNLAGQSLGGLAGASSGVITASYAAGPVSGTGSGTIIGGFVGTLTTAAVAINDGYCDTTLPTSTASCIGTHTGGAPASVTAQGATTAQLQTPAGYTGPFANFNVDVDGDTFPDNPWNFGTTTTYPALKTPAQRQADPVVDYDDNDNNLIDINNLHQLNAIRHDLNGDGLPANLPAYAGAFPNGDFVTTTPAAARMGCPDGCEGYELAQDLTFSTSTSSPYTPWTPIGSPFVTTFDGNGHTLTGLSITSGSTYTGLFGQLDTGAVIRDLGLIDGSVRSGIAVSGVGMLAGENFGGTITAVYAQGGNVYFGATGINVGGLVGGNQGTITASYSTAAMTRQGTTRAGSILIGGLVGLLSQSGNKHGAIINSYAAAPWSGSSTPTNGGLLGTAQGGNVRVTGSYCDTTVAAWGGCVNTATANTPAAGKTTAQLQAPTGYTGIYADWNSDFDGDTFPDYPWDFGATTTYPTLYTPTQRQAAAAVVVDYDRDDDNLIDIRNLHQLNAIRYDLDGNGLPAAANYSAYSGGFPNGNISDTSTPYMGCESTCAGYELAEDLTFSTSTSNPYTPWTPIGNPFVTTFDGNGNTLTGLSITSGSTYTGLFGQLDTGAVIRDLGLIDGSVRAGIPLAGVGMLAGENGGGTITAVSVQGGSVYYGATGLEVGGLVGGNQGTITASYSTAAMHREGTTRAGSILLGGLVGLLAQDGNKHGKISNSYAAAPRTGSSTSTPNNGGLVGTAQGGNVRITGSYCDTTVAAWGRCVSTATGNTPAESKTTAELQSPTGYTGIYANWNSDFDGDTFPDYPWNFGTTTTYPTLYTPSERQTAAAVVVDYDSDNDNLIDIRNPHQLNALRYDPDGDGRPDDAANYSAYSGGYPNGNIADTGTPYMGCESTCAGYELMANLDFAADGATVTAADDYPDWTPIASYGSTLDGKGYTIARLTIAGADANAGLFAALTGDAVIRDLGIIAPAVTSGGASANAGALVGNNGGLITASYIDGGSVTVTGATPNVGGLAGQNTGDIRAVWSDASVNASTTGAGNGGGLIGIHSGRLSASYAAGPVTGSSGAVLGGLIGAASAAITASYCDTTATTRTNCIGRATGGAAAAGYPTSELQTPTGYTGIYEAWAISLTPGDNTRYNVWNFGEATDYPTLYRPADRQLAAPGDTLPPPLPRSIPPEPEKPYDPAADHPEIYANAEYEMAATCETHDVDPETGNPRAATVTFDLGSYTGPVLLHLSIWANGRYMAYETQGLASPGLERDGQSATVRVDTDPAQTRFRLDGRRHGLATNLVLGYADCRSDDP